MEGSTTTTRLRAFLDETGTRPRWLAERIGVSRQQLQSWLAGARPVPEAYRTRIILVLRKRQLVAIPTDLFETEE
jgi:hypothetical protein